MRDPRTATADDGGGGPPLTLAELERWELFGADSRVVSIGEDRAVVDLCTCTGELVERRDGTEPALLAHLRRAEGISAERGAAAPERPPGGGA